MPATSATIDAYTTELGETIADMGCRIAANGGEPSYSAEKAAIAAHAAIRVIARADAHYGDNDTLEQRLDRLRNAYIGERRSCLEEE